MSVVIPTTSGAGFIAQAGPLGPYVPIRYFLPVYDHRIDPFVHPASSTVDVSAADPVSATSVIGEVIYNVSALNTASPGSYTYSIYPTELLPFDSAASTSGSGTSRQVAGSSYDAVAFVNKLNSSALSTTISGTSITYLGANWLVLDYTVLSGSNINPYSPATNRNRFFRVQSYGPITSAEGGNARGLFKLRLPKTVGTFKFNKIALYAAKFLADGSEDTGTEPVLFAIVALNNPILKTSDATNLNNFELDLELQFSSQGVVSQLSYLGNDYWNRFNNTLWHDGKVAIASLSALPGSWQANAKLNISVHENENLPLLRFGTNVGAETGYLDYELTATSYQHVLERTTSQPSLAAIYRTSGFDTYTESIIQLDSLTKTRNLSLNFSDAVSGDVNSGFYFTYGGYADTASVQVHSNTLMTIRSANGAFGNITIHPLDSYNAQEFRNKALAVHGGTVLIGTNVVSGTLSANDTITAYGLYSNNDVTAVRWLNTQLGVLAFGGDQTSYFDNLRIVTSGDFRGSITVTGTISGNNTINTRYLYAAADVNATSYLVAGQGVLAFGSNQVSWFDTLRSSVSADFNGPVRMNQRLTTIDSISAAKNVSAYGGFYELDRGTANGYWKSYSSSLSVDSGSIQSTTHNRTAYTFVGKTLIIDFDIAVSFTTTATTYLYFTLPESKVSSTVVTSLGYFGVCFYSMAGDSRINGYVSNAAGTNYVALANPDISNALAAGTTVFYRGSITIPVD